ncbi:MAG TPA: RHS repeat-associated core domain-containing protein [Blastocatellia bacterium]|nr:RHS repeat-associated core domain-containing protein [Blastocatellia bacterium]
MTANTYSYDADDRLGSDQYDADGNTTLSTGTANTYDFENRMVTHGNVSIVYDGDGNRVAETVGGVTTQYLVDTQNLTGYAQVVDELQNGAVTRAYSYGLERISETQPIHSTLTTSFYGYDGHGSVRQLTNATGTVTDTYTYDAFGNLISSTGSTPNVYLFAGEQFDPALGLYYNRARYLDTATGRFWSMDTYAGSSADPPSLHHYAYARGNPANRLDPSGNDDLAEISVSTGIDQTLNAISVVSRGAVIGGLFGCVAGALDKNNTCANGAVGGAVMGAVLGPLAEGVAALRYGKILLAIASTGMGGWGAYGAYKQGQYGLAAFYVVSALGTSMLLGLSANGDPAAPEPQPAPTDPLALPAGPPDLEQPWAGTITSTVLEQDIVAYRVSSQGTPGAWLTPIRPATSADAISSLALPPGNTASYVQEVVIPAGTRIQVGIANGAFGQTGGGIQIQLLDTIPSENFGTPTPLH